MESVIATFSKSLEQFARDISKKFFIPEEDVIKYTNSYWSLNIPPSVTLEQALKNMTIKTSRSNSISNSKSNSRAGSEASTPRTSVETSSSTQLEKKKKEVKGNKCQYVFQSGKSEGKVCDAACEEKYCKRHQAAKSNSRDKKEDNPLERKHTEPVTTELVDTGKRKMQKKIPANDNLSALIDLRRMVLKTIKNKFGNYEHPETRLVIDKETEVFFGKQLDDGTIAELTINDIEWCKSMKLAYQLPSKLGNVNTSLEVDNDDYEELSEEEDD